MLVVEEGGERYRHGLVAGRAEQDELVQVLVPGAGNGVHFRWWCFEDEKMTTSD
jgi:hypothetical protein